MTLALIVSAALLGLAAIDSTGAGPIWDIFNGFGLVCLGFLAALQVETLRHRLRFGHPAAGAIATHTRIAYFAFGALVFHAGGLLIADSITFEYVSLRAPLYMIAGLAAVALIAWLAITSTSRRRREHGDPPDFRNIHRFGGLVLLALAGWHVIGVEHFYTSWPTKAAVVALLCACAFVPAVFANRLIGSWQPGGAATALAMVALIATFVLARNL